MQNPKEALNPSELQIEWKHFPIYPSAMQKVVEAYNSGQRNYIQRTLEKLRQENPLLHIFLHDQLRGRAYEQCGVEDFCRGTAVTYAMIQENARKHGLPELKITKKQAEDPDPLCFEDTLKTMHRNTGWNILRGYIEAHIEKFRYGDNLFGTALYLIYPDSNFAGAYTEGVVSTYLPLYFHLNPPEPRLLRRLWNTKGNWLKFRDQG